MVNRIITGISQKIDSEFNLSSEDYAIHTENLEQGLNEPCFFIFSLKPSSTQIVGNRYKRDYPFDIHYFPSNALVDGVAKTNYELNEVEERLMDVLEYITVDGGLARGTKMNAETIDNVLHFFVNYNMIVKKDIPKEDSMENLKVNPGLKG